MTGTRLGWLGGTFDPIHCGHLDVARAARAAMRLNRVHLAPAGVPPHRAAPVASPEDRFQMATLAAAPYDWLEVSDIELATDAPSYTMDTLDRLAARGVDLRALYVTTGADAFAEILTWKDASNLLDRCSFVVVSRPGHPVEALPRQLPALADRMADACTASPAPHQSIFLVDAVTAPVTSTEIRARVAGQQPLTGLVPDAVADYISTHNLYQGGV